MHIILIRFRPDKNLGDCSTIEAFILVNGHVPVPNASFFDRISDKIFDNRGGPVDEELGLHRKGRHRILPDPCPYRPDGRGRLLDLHLASLPPFLVVILHDGSILCHQL